MTTMSTTRAKDASLSSASSPDYWATLYCAATGSRRAAALRRGRWRLLNAAATEALCLFLPSSSPGFYKTCLFIAAVHC